MSHTVFCTKLQKEAEGLDMPPYPGELGQRIYQSICQEAWSQWVNRQTMFINEYRLNLSEPKAREFLKAEMEKFLFSDENNTPAGYTPEK